MVLSLCNIPQATLCLLAYLSMPQMLELSICCLLYLLFGTASLTNVCPCCRTWKQPGRQLQSSQNQTKRALQQGSAHLPLRLHLGPAGLSCLLHCTASFQCMMARCNKNFHVDCMPATPFLVAHSVCVFLSSTKGCDCPAGTFCRKT